MKYLGDFAEDAVVHVYFTTNGADGAAIAPSSAFAAADFKVYKDDGTAQPGTTGFTVTSPFDSNVGLHLLKIATSAHAFYATGANYSVALDTAKTVDGKAVMAVLGDFSVENRSLQNRLPAALVSGRMDSDVQAVSGSTTAADNAELQYDGTTGLDGETFPASQAQLDQIANVGSALNKPPKDSPAGFVITWGENEVNNEDSTHAVDGTYHVIEAQDDTGTEKIDVYYEFAIGGDGVPSSVHLQGRFDRAGAAKNLTVHAWNWVTSSWRQIGTLGSTFADIVDSYDLFTAEVGTGANLGTVRIRFLTGSVALSATDALHIDQIFLAYSIVARSVGYDGGAVWVDTTASGTAGTESFVNGTADNPVLTWADALILAGNLNLHRFEIVSGSSIQLSANSDGFVLRGTNWNLDLNGQSIVEVAITGAHLTGIGVAASGDVHLTGCLIGAATLPPSILLVCGIGENFGTFTAGSAGDYTFVNCFSKVPGSGAPVFAFTGLGSATGISNRAWSGGGSWTLDGDCTISIEVIAGGTQTVITGGADVEIRGTCAAVAVTVSASETVRLVGVNGPITIAGAATAAVVSLYGVSGPVADTSTGTTVTDETLNQANINTECDTALTDYAGPTKAEMDTAHALLATDADMNAVGVIVAAIRAVTDLLPDSGALTTIGTDTARLTAVRAAILTDWIDGGRLDLLLDSIITTLAGTLVVRLADGVTHGGSSAILSLQKVLVAATGNDPAVSLAGAGAGHGLSSIGGSSGDGVNASGGSFSGDGISGSGVGVARSGIRADGGFGGHGIHANSGNSGHGILARGDGAGDGINAAGGASGLSINAAILNAIKAVTDLLPDAGALDDLAAILLQTGTTGVVVGDILQAALAKFITTDTGETAAVAGSVAELSKALTTVILGAVQVAVNPGNRVGSPIALEMFAESAKTFSLSIEDANGDPVDLSSMALRFVVADENSPPNGQFQVEEPTITVTGTNNEVANVPVSTVQSAAANAHWRWWLWNTLTDAVLAHGSFTILPAEDEVV